MKIYSTIVWYLMFAGLIIAQNKPLVKNTKVAYFSSGCFWCVEAIYERVKGVHKVLNGYAGGVTQNPTYETLHGSGHAETVAVYYDSKIVSFDELVKVFYASQNPTTKGQYPDMGDTYRSIIFYSNETEKQIACQNVKEQNVKYVGRVVTEILPFKHFYVAEDYHQDYEKRHPNQPYIQQISIPRLERFKKQLPQMLQKEAKHIYN